MTPRQLEALRYVEDYARSNGVAPTVQELADHLRVSKPTALSHLRALERAKAIRRRPYRRRAIEVTAPSRKLPVIGRIAAGRPLEALAQPGDLDLAAPARGGAEHFVLEVRGDSMIEDGIRDGDFVVCERRSAARDGETVVALFEDGTATLKRLYREKGRVRLQPANASMAPIYADRVDVQGVVVAVHRLL